MYTKFVCIWIFNSFLQKERLNYQKEYMDSIKKLEEKWMMSQQKHASDEKVVGINDDSSDVTSKEEVILYSI